MTRPMRGCGEDKTCSPGMIAGCLTHERVRGIRASPRSGRAPNSTMQYSTVSVPIQAPMPYSTARYPIQASVSAAPIAYSAGISAAPMMPYGTVSVPIGATMQVGMAGQMPPPIMHPDPVPACCYHACLLWRRVWQRGA